MDPNFPELPKMPPQSAKYINKVLASQSNVEKIFRKLGEKGINFSTKDIREFVDVIPALAVAIKRTVLLFIQVFSYSGDKYKGMEKLLQDIGLTGEEMSYFIEKCQSASNEVKEVVKELNDIQQYIVESNHLLSIKGETSFTVIDVYNKEKIVLPRLGLELEAGTPSEKKSLKFYMTIEELDILIQDLTEIRSGFKREIDYIQGPLKNIVFKEYEGL